MSLFGTSPEGASNTKSTLFDEAPKTAQSSGLFADDGPSAVDDSPWGFQPTPKKQARANLVRTLLPASDAPDFYIDTFEALAAGSTVRFTDVGKLLDSSGLSAQDQQRIVDLVSPPGSPVADSVGRGEFNVILALIGLAQEGEEISLDSVDDRRRRLPQPILPKISKSRPESPRSHQPPPVYQTSTPAAKIPTNNQPRQKQDRSYSITETDPWASPANTKATNGNTNGIKSNMGDRTTSTFTTGGADAASDFTPTQTPASSTRVSKDWSYGGSTTGESTFGAESIDDGGFSSSSVIGANDGTLARPRKQHTTRQISHGAEEEVTILALPEKQGTLLFQYRNYEVSTARRNSKVVRRYSDFVWLLDCLHKRYPFRQLPLLPPKRVSINGNHIAADATFIEKRRRGLQRFANALVRHPILSQEQLVVMFLTVPTELSVWRKQASITVQEEFAGKPLPPGLEDSLPATLDDLFNTVRSGVRRSSEVYINLCNSLERLVKRREGLSSEYSRFSTLLTSATETNPDTYKIDTNDVPLLNEGITSTAKHVEQSSGILLDESQSWDEGALEDFKRQRDGLVSMRDMFDRRDRYAKDTIPQCERRIASNEAKLNAVRNKPEPARKVGEAEKLEDAITKDKESIVQQHARGVFIKECIRDELQIFQSTQYHITRMHQDWSADRLRFAELQLECWRELNGELESMPGGPEHEE